MAYVATALTRGKDDWSAAELDLGGAADLEEITDQLREVDPEAEVSLLLVEADDSYLVVVRLDAGEDPRVFASDAAFAEENRLGAVLLSDIEVPVLELDEAIAEAEAGAAAQRAPEFGVAPVGDPELLADLGMPAARLLAICGREGMLPADMTAEVAQEIGAGDEFEELREE